MSHRIPPPQLAWPWAVAGFAALVLALGVFTRGWWKPDEPREAAIAAAMSRPGASWAVPMLGGEPFCEKPPLTYWLSQPAIAVAGPMPWAMRIPNLLLGIAACLLTGLLAAHVAGARAALWAGGAMAVMYLPLRVEWWYATDAVLLTCTVGALYAGLRGVRAEHSVQGAWRVEHKFGWYALMHVALGLGFLGKSVLIMIAPGAALVAVVLWERRWRELWAWQLHLGWLISFGICAAWIMTVLVRHDGHDLIRIFLADNLLGRFMDVPGNHYSQGHRGWWGKYLVELPVDVAPLTLLLVPAAVHAWRALKPGSMLPRQTGGEALATGWRFGWCAVLLPLLILSASHTQRDVYAIVAMPGAALLIGLWAVSVSFHDGKASTQAAFSFKALDRYAVMGTAALLGLMALLLPVAGVVLRLLYGQPEAWMWPLATVGIALGMWVARTGWRRIAAADLDGLARIWGVQAMVLAATTVPLVMPVIDRSQDLRPVVELVSVLVPQRVAHWDPDETIVATFELEAGAILAAVQDESALRTRLAQQSDLHLLVEVTPGKSRGISGRTAAIANGMHEVRRIDLPPPGGRSYAVFAR